MASGSRLDQSGFSRELVLFFFFFFFFKKVRDSCVAYSKYLLNIGLFRFDFILIRYRYVSCYIAFISILIIIVFAF